jgi:RNA polymerase sigma-70 factor (ECF subfamily)
VLRGADSRQRARRDEFERDALPHTAALLRVARRLTGKTYAAEDLVQETLLLAWRGFDGYRRGTNIRAWLFRIMFNVFYGQERKFTPVLTTLSPVLAGPSGDPESALEVSRALQALGADHRAVLMLGVVEGFTCQEMAGVLGVPIGTVMSRMSRAREALKRRLESRVGPALETSCATKPRQ